MKKLIALLIVLFAMPSVALAVTMDSGAIWTTNNDCGDKNQDVNHYAHGDVVYINGNNFAPGDYSWDISGVSKCDKNVQVITGTYHVNSREGFCFSAYTIADDDCGEYKASLGGKHDNYQVKDVTSVPEFSLIAASIAFAGAGAGYLLLRRKN